MSNILLGNVKDIKVVKATISPAAIEGSLTGEQTFTVNGLQTNDIVFVRKPTAQAGLGIAGARVSAANTLAINFVNATASTQITPTAAEVYTLLVVRVDDINNIPTSFST